MTSKKGAISIAIGLLKKNEVIAIPTETVYGLAGNALNESAVKKIFEIKKRPFFNPLIVHIKSIESLDSIATEIPDTAYRLAKAFWPGALTLVLKKQPNIPYITTGSKDTVAVRVPNHPIILELLNSIDFPLAAPSANPFGYLSPTTSEHVREQLGDKIPYILEGGKCSKGVESTIIGFEGNKPVIYRLGAISVEEIEKVTGKLDLKNYVSTSSTQDIEKSPNAPGMLLKHYSPLTPIYLTDSVTKMITKFKNMKIGLLLFGEQLNDESIHYQEVLSNTRDLNEAAATLFEKLHKLDKMKLDVIIAEKLPAHGLGNTINDRLQRAEVK